MKVYHGIGETTDVKGCCLALGNFDGVHRGHQALIGLVVEKARGKGVASVVLTFEPHPAVVLAPGASPDLLTTQIQKEELIAGLGVDYLYFLPFSSSVASLSPEDFVTDLLWPYFRPSLVAVGFNYSFGRGGRGKADLLKTLGREIGFEVVVLPPVRIGEQVVSSTAVREALAAGDLSLARELLGYWPTLAGKVVKGDRRGRTLGFPTANIAVPPEIKLPAYGVYACRMFLPDGTWRPGVANIGKRPTFGRGLSPTVEVYLLDFSGNLYGRQVRIELRFFLRPEKAFARREELIAQIDQDVRLARELLQA
ncbi:bifunctional riboflavin kinase/FAD synthetase [Moorellaceae bacterium AZ2]